MAGRRMNGEGSVYHRCSDDRWVGAVVVGYTPTGTVRRKTVSAKTKTEVLAKMKAVRRQIEDGLPPQDDRLTVGQLLDRWMADVLRHQVAPIAFENYRSVAESPHPADARTQAAQQADACRRGCPDVGQARCRLLGQHRSSHQGPSGPGAEPGRAVGTDRPQRRRRHPGTPGRPQRGANAYAEAGPPAARVLERPSPRGAVRHDARPRTPARRGTRAVVDRRVAGSGSARDQPIVEAGRGLTRAGRGEDGQEPAVAEHSQARDRVFEEPQISARLTSVWPWGRRGWIPARSSRHRLGRRSTLATSTVISWASAREQASGGGTPTNFAIRRPRSCWRRESRSRWSPIFSGTPQSG